MKTVYFDNNATTKVAEEVLDEITPLFSDLYGNPSSMHTFGGQMARRVRKAREQVAALLGCDPTEIIFTSGGTESDNAAIQGTLTASPNRGEAWTTTGGPNAPTVKPALLQRVLPARSTTVISMV